jgi:hypothetical protein
MHVKQIKDISTVVCHETAFCSLVLNVSNCLLIHLALTVNNGNPYMSMLDSQSLQDFITIWKLSKEKVPSGKISIAGRGGGDIKTQTRSEIDHSQDTD